MTLKTTPIFNQVQPIIIIISSSCPEFVSPCKKSDYSINVLRYCQYRDLKTELPHPFLTRPTPKRFTQLLISMNLYQHTKNHAILSFCSRDICDLKIIQSDWPKAFWAISQELHFFRIWDLCRSVANTINFYYTLNSKKINAQTFK